MKRAANPLYLLLASLLITSLACNLTQRSLDAIEGGEERSAAEAEDGPDQALNCEREGYPCSYAETDPAILEATVALADAAAERFENGASMEEVAQWLQTQEDVADVVNDQLALRFRMQDGPGFWVMDAALLEPGTKAAPSPAGAQGVPFFNPFFDEGPVGEDTPGEEPSKRALLLSPFLYDFKIDETAPIGQTLREHRNYKCQSCIERKVNIMNAAGTITYGVSLADFESWENYDIIHISTHGSQVCRGETESTPGNFTPALFDCYTALYTGNVFDRAGTQNDLTAISVDPVGVEWVLVSNACPPVTAADGSEAYAECRYGTRLYQTLSADYFRFHYPGGLDDKMIFFSACESMKDLSLANAIIGQDTAVLGWTESVDAGMATKIALKFYEFLISDGLRIEKAFEKTKDYFANSLTADALSGLMKGGGSVPSASAEILSGGSQEPRGREVITWLHPVFREELTEGATVPIEGIAGDGQPDTLQVLFQIDGIDESQNPEDFLIHVSVDGVERPETFRPVRKVDEFSYWAEGSLVLPFDALDLEQVKLDAWVDLPEGGRSRHVLEKIEPAVCGWTASLSDPQAGEIKGDMVLSLEKLLSADPAIAQALQGEGLIPDPEQLAAPLDLPSTGDAQPPFALIMKDGPRFLVFSEEGGLALSLAPGSLDGFYMNRDRERPLPLTINLLENSAERIKGSVSTSVTRGLIPDGETFTLAADFIWEARSYCDFEIIYQLYLNAQADRALPAGSAP